MHMLNLEYRDSARGPWKRCDSDWKPEDVAWLNAAVGYEKYRVSPAVAR